MNIPKGIGWSEINRRIKNLNIVGINHLSLGLPANHPTVDKKEVQSFFSGMTSLLSIEKLQREIPTEVFLYHQKDRIGYEHLLWAGKQLFFHIELDCTDESDTIKNFFPESIEEKPGMFWITVSENFLSVLWAVIITNKRYKVPE